MKGHLAGILDGGAMLVREADNHRELYHPGDDPWMRNDLFPLAGLEAERERLGTSLDSAFGPPALHPDFKPAAMTRAPSR
jgi:hypothetical protein